MPKRPLQAQRRARPFVLHPPPNGADSVCEDLKVGTTKIFLYVVVVVLFHYMMKDKVKLGIISLYEDL